MCNVVVGRMLKAAGIEVEKTAEERIEALVADLVEWKVSRAEYLDLAKLLDRHLPEVNS